MSVCVCANYPSFGQVCWIVYKNWISYFDRNVLSICDVIYIYIYVCVCVCVCVFVCLIYIYVHIHACIVIYKALCFDVAQGRMNWTPNENQTHSCRFASQACWPLHHQRRPCMYMYMSVCRDYICIYQVC